MAKCRVYNPELAKQIEEWASVGITQPKIASMVGMSEKQLRDVYRKELDRGRNEGDGKILNALFDEAVNKRNTPVLIFLGKTRCHLSETQKVEMTAKHKVVLFGEDDPVEAISEEDGDI